MARSEIQTAFTIPPEGGESDVFDKYYIEEQISRSDSISYEIGWGLRRRYRLVSFSLGYLIIESIGPAL
ncbi:hypothetical protein A0H81_06842 [Grifola frondosa]|uniref:Uncharacterized protein n=1 Tax=Grifola frondosa TaxID=5627 RepID=A0A1C7M7Q6_GRIFR|nr:hypothetical protein A0H81_06842 [Grifola frondosa]